VLVLRRWVECRPSVRERFDGAGAFLSMVALTGLVLSLSAGGVGSWGSPEVVGGLVATAIALPIFLWVQRRRTDPLVDLSLFEDRQAAMAYVSLFLVSMARFTVVVIMALFFQAASGLDAFEAGLRVSPVAAGMMISAPLAGRLAARYSVRLLSSAGLAVTAAGLLTLAFTLGTMTSYLVVGGASDWGRDCSSPRIPVRSW
jgi:predicted MFS family arabinose efflux permease